MSFLVSGTAQRTYVQKDSIGTSLYCVLLFTHMLYCVYPLQTHALKGGTAVPLGVG